MKKIYFVILILMHFVSSWSVAQCLTPSVVPYYEGFQGISVNNQLPVCWAVSNTVTCLTFTGTPNNNYAAFFNSPAGNNYFYTNAILLNTGITYSMSCFFKVTSSNSGWTNFSLFVGPNQGITGLLPVASTNSTVVNTVYTPLTNTFTVPSSGIYYAVINAATNGLGTSPYLYWEDLLITTPCAAPYNTVNLSISASSYSICRSSSFTLTAAGANTYSWNTGVTTPIVTYSPTLTTAYTVTGTSTLTNCSATATTFIVVSPKPVVSVTANSPNICAGSTLNLVATGANTYSWNGGQTGPVIGVSPLSAKVYTVTGTNAFGCSNTATIQIGVNLLPVITVTNMSQPGCLGEPVILNASGANFYQWNSGIGSYTGASVQYTTASLTTTFNVFGTDNNNCIGQANYMLTVSACTAIKQASQDERTFKIYPNPSQGLFILESSSDPISIAVTDLFGKIIFASSVDKEVLIDLKSFSDGIYFVKMFSGNATSIYKIVKQE